MKFCIDCKHIFEPRLGLSLFHLLNGSARRCAHPEHMNPVDGRPLLTCREMRLEYPQCGLDGDLWEAKTP